MAALDIYARDIFRFADLCIEAGCFPGLEDGHYVLLLIIEGLERCEIRRADENCLLPGPCRVWLAKGRSLFLLGDSHICPVDLADGCRPPFLG